MNLKGRIPELDGLRGVAIGMVLLYHYFFAPIEAPLGSFLSYFQVVGRLGWSGVDLFFVLSGFLIGGILLDARQSTNYFRVFYTRRFFRIIPIYYAFLLLVLALGALGTFGLTSNFSWMFAMCLPWLPQFLFLQNFWMALLNNFGAHGPGVTWSLAVEEQFYLTLPPLVRFVSLRNLGFALAAGILFAPISRIALHVFAPSHLVSFYVLMPCRADALLLGVVGAVLLRDNVWKERLARHRRVFPYLLVPLGLGVAVLGFRFSESYGAVMLSVGYTWFALFYLSVIFCALLYPESWFGGCMRWGWLRWLGSIAYGVYLFHDFIRYTLLSVVFSGDPGHWSPSQSLISLVSSVVTLLICWLSWTFFEKPLVQVGHRAHYEIREKETANATLTGKLSPVE